MSRRLGVVRFPGTNCDADVWQAAEMAGLKPEWLWHTDQFDKKDWAALMLPGGFSYGDYLRCGALAAKSPVMASVREAAAHGVPVLGICNGFQILCESGLLPGVLVRNRDQRFVDNWVILKIENPSPHFGPHSVGERSRLPIAHGEGCYQADSELVKRLEDGEQIWVSYVQDVNGSTQGIAGVLNDKKNVAGLMPHPERAMQTWMGGTDGKNYFTSLLT